MAFPANTAKLSPMMKQYLAIKEQHMDELLFYRLGDFYEMFFDDAVTASRELELVLTGRDCGLPERAPMCGVPFHSYEGYVARLIAKGYKVAICEQMEDPALAKGIVDRGIIRVVTPGTVTDACMLSEGKNNYICCLFLGKDGFGLSFADISTGVAYVTETGASAAAAFDELARFEPSEILCNNLALSDAEFARRIEKNSGVRPFLLYDGYFDADAAKGYIAKQFDAEKTQALTQYKRGYGVRALGALLKYIEETQFHGAARLVGLEVYRCVQYLSVGATARKNLELTQTLRAGERRGSLLWVIDRTVTASGKRTLRSMLEKPLMDVGDINARLDATQELYNDTIELAKLREALDGIFDIERLMTRVIYRTCTPRDLRSLAETCRRIAGLKQTAAPLTAPLLTALREQLCDLSDIERKIDDMIAEDPPALLKDGGYIRFGYDPNVDELHSLVSNSKAYIARLEASLREKTGIKNLRIGYNRVFGYYIEVSKSNADSVPESFIRKQTLANGERYINEELKELETKILSASERLNMLERQLYEELLGFLELAVWRVQQTAVAVGMLDALCSYAALARENGYCRPTVDGAGAIVIRNGRHPVVEKVIDGELYVPNDTLLDGGDNLVNLITGPNMAGKSTYMRATALIVLLAQMGRFVPASSAKIGVVDAIYTRVGASDDLFSGDSTFMVEMKEVAEILRCATKHSLIILDEIGRGTSTYDGMSIARAVIEEICRKGGIGAKTMFATHYHELTEMDGDFANIKNYNIAVKKRGDDITFLRRIVTGPADDSYGIEVAKLAGLPDTAISRAKEILAAVEARAGEPARRRRQPEQKTDAAAEILRAL
ncbi:MAG: DNA mismatch repair protein MutS, partial [Oscillospiraceae bacterium]|nr:DNA mismatch repair protein MutS [Oscillospiraceae bacterium]